MESFGSYIKRLRLSKKLNQTELAALVGLDSGGLSKVENDKKSVNEEKLILFAKALNIEIEEMKSQYLSEKFAKECFDYKISTKVFHLAEEKTKYYKAKNIKQINLDLK